MRSIKITGTGSALPDREVTNADLEKMVDTSDAWIVERTGIRTRRICDAATSASDLGTLAARRALENAGRKIEDIDLIIVTTSTPDHLLFPSTGAIIQDNLGGPHTPAFDISAACTGFVYGLTTAKAYMDSGMYNRILLVCTDTLSKYLDWEDRGTCILFGDGAGALVLETEDRPDNCGILAFDLHADGAGREMLIVPAGGSRRPCTPEVYAERECFIKMDGPAVYKFAVNTIVKTVQTCLTQAGLTEKDIDLFIPHQANSRIVNYAAQKLGLADSQVKVNLDRIGNTSSASIPIVMDELNRAGGIKRGDLIVAVGFGAGLTWGSCLIRW